MKKHPLKEILGCRKGGKAKGMYSICSANEYVIEAALRKAKKQNSCTIIESTVNQVNQYGGYSGMKPSNFKDFVTGIANRLGFESGNLILGGDHLGPIPWKEEKAETAMHEACELIKQYVLAGYTKIHIDTSVHLADDDKSRRLSTELIAERGVRLAKAAEDAYNELKASNPEAVHPVYVIGSDVPPPGGSQSPEEMIHITDPGDFQETVEVYKNAFSKNSLYESWENVIAVVVQPGVEFTDEDVFEYNRKAAGGLVKALNKYPNLVFEGHSTDYQTRTLLKYMVEDGIAILKVGPAMTFALREAAFALNDIENEILGTDPYARLSGFKGVLEQTMLKYPDNWDKYYTDDITNLKLFIKYSFYDRCRYYLNMSEVKDSFKLMLSNLDSTSIPLTLISQFMPMQYNKIRSGELRNEPKELIIDRITNCLDDYVYAVFLQQSQ